MESLFPTHAPTRADEQRVLLPDVSWATYVSLRDSIESPAVRMTYLEGLLEVMTVSREHEVSRKMIARLLELFCLERDIPLYGYGQMTVRKEERERGLEPDEWYCRGKDSAVPQLAIEVIVSHGAIDKLEVYRGLEILEVWLYEGRALRVLALRDGRYTRVASSALFPEIDLERVAYHAAQPDQHAALVAFRDELRDIER